MQFFLNGGFPMWVIMVFGLLGVVNAGRFAWAPSPGRIGYLVAIGLAVLFAGIGGTATDIMTVCFHIPQNDEWAHSPDLHLILLQGLGESLSPIIFASGLLMAQAILAGLGLRRLVG